MNDIIYGIPIEEHIGPLEFSIKSGTIFIWRDSPNPSAIFCDRFEDIPKSWPGSDYALKIFGEFSTIKKIFGKFKIPPGSKIIDLSQESVVYFSLKEKKISYRGIRNKRVLVVDDSPTIRKLLVHLISSFEGWKVVSEVENAEGIGPAIEECYPDIVTLDLHLGEINGVQAMRKSLAPKKVPTLLITSQAMKDGSLVMEALSAGALDYLQKPESGKWDLMKEELHSKMETALKAKWQVTTLKSVKLLNINEFNFDPSKFLVVIGSSTGGTQALQEIFTRLPANIPPILVTQHIPAGFSKALADRLNSLCPFEIKEAEQGDEVKMGRVLIAPGNHHMELSKCGKFVNVIDSPPVNRFRPSVQTMFSSLLEYKKLKIIAVMLTGMGKDGANAMLELKQRGSLTIAQDEESSVVFGMPKEAIKIGAVQHVKPLLEIPECMVKLMSQNKK